MKNFRIYFLLILWFFGACEEIPPQINPAAGEQENTDTPVAEQQRQVLMEEFSGVRCVNCPAGSEAIQALVAIYGERLVPVSIHAGFFAEPYPESRYDFQTQAGYGILDYLGQPLGFPTAVINRKQFAGEESFQLNQSKWAGYLATELALPPSIKIDLQSDYRTSDRSLEVIVDLYVQEDITAEDLRLSVMITEDKIPDFQLTPEGKKGNYLHRHVFRQILTDYNGMRLNGDLSAGKKVSKSFTATLPEAWQAENCTIVAFVHLNGDRKEVLQAHQISVIQ